MNIGDIHDCYGCGVCAVVCRRKLIDIKLNKYGFYEPYIIDSTQCTDCGLCVKVCSFSHNDYALKDYVINSYAAWSLDENVRHICSSGGVGFEIGRNLIEDGYKVCGVRYNAEKERAEHYIANSINELTASMGSKYIQSYTLNGFNSIFINEKYLVTGTPCQIDSFRRYIQLYHCESQFVLMDFFCHGVPSIFVWNKYLNKVKKTIGDINSVVWREKSTGWHDSWAMTIEGENGKHYISRKSQGDIFYLLFLSNSCLNKACYEKCRYKHLNSSADIRLCDLWGTKYKLEDKGVNGVITFTEKGKNLLKSSNCHIIEESIDVVTEKQMKEPPLMPDYSDKVWQQLLDTTTNIGDVAIYPIRAKRKKRLIEKIRRLFQIESYRKS